MEIKNITIIGKGNVSEHYFSIMSSKHLNCKQISSREVFDFKDLDCDLIILAVKDEAVDSVIDRIALQFADRLPLKAIVTHTSGFLSTDNLQKIASDYGSFYPLQTLKKGVDIDFSKVPLCTWASTDWADKSLEVLAKKLSNIHYNLTDNQRKTLHLAAVFANNFTNHLFGIAKEILNKDDIDFSILYPLMDRTLESVKNNNPFDIQTGPAYRNETSIMQQHKDRLNDNDKAIYEVLSKSIQRRNINTD